MISERTETVLALLIAAVGFAGAVWLFIRLVEWITAFLPEWAR